MYPTKIGIVTSGSGAAFKDIISVLERRAPQVRLVLKLEVKVQGDGSSRQICEAIELFNFSNSVDVIIIIGRGVAQSKTFGHLMKRL